MSEEPAGIELDIGTPFEASSSNGIPRLATAMPALDRRSELDAKQAVLGAMIVEAGTSGLLLFDPANLGWFAGAALCQGIPDPADWPAIYLTDNQRWLLCGSADTQRLFDLHLDGLGFQLKEWPWHWGRERLLADLVQNRKLACDRVLAGSVPFGPALRRLRLTLSFFERERLFALGRELAHALEATGRNLEPRQSEDEIAGEVAHRLLKHGITPQSVSVSADGRSDRHRRPGVSTARLQRRCTLGAVAQRQGLHAFAARTIVFGSITPAEQREHDGTLAIAAALVAAARPGTQVAAVLDAARGVASANHQEPEWFRGPTGHVTGWLPVERPIIPSLNYALDGGWAVTWQPSIGAALGSDTWIVADTPSPVTPPESWPIKRVRIRDTIVDLPDILGR